MIVGDFLCLHVVNFVQEVSSSVLMVYGSSCTEGRKEGQVVKGFVKNC